MDALLTHFRFNLPQLQETLPAAQSQEIITTLHGILKPFLLRRLKAEVELNLPPKKEYVLYAPLSVRQREAYDRVLDGDLRSWLIGGGTAAEKEEAGPSAIVEDSEEEDEEAVGLEEEGDVPIEDVEEEPGLEVRKEAARPTARAINVALRDVNISKEGTVTVAGKAEVGRTQAEIGTFM